jgi:hypothetical protein
LEIHGLLRVNWTSDSLVVGISIAGGLNRRRWSLDRGLDLEVNGHGGESLVA